jgi:hypothetical protein
MARPSRHARRNLHRRPPLDDLDSKILEILEKSPFESSHSIAEILLVTLSIVLLHLHASIGFKSFHLCWVPHLLSDDFSKNERSMQKICCHSCMLPNVMAGIILWLVMSRGFSLIHYHVGCGLCREMMWPQNRDSKFRAKVYADDSMESDWVLCCRQTFKYYQNE